MSILLMLLVGSATSGQAQADAPCPPSPLIARVEFDFHAREKRAPGSDNWPVTWASDGFQYAVWGDGGGFGGSDSDGRASLGVARIEGMAPNYRGINLWGGKDALAQAQFGGKSYGILALGDTLYMWVSPGSGAENNEEARLACSEDHGLTWTHASWAFTKADGIMAPAICQFGRGYGGARDTYVYVYSTRLFDAAADVQRPGAVDLLRVPKDKLTSRAAYDIFAGFDATGQPAWTRNLDDRRAVLDDPTGLHRLSVTYNAGLKRYLLCVEHSEGYAGNLAIFDAPEPWGPWTSIEYAQNWGGFGATFFWCIPPKWISADGTSFTMVFTGTGENDAWNTVPGRFVLRARQKDLDPESAPESAP